MATLLAILGMINGVKTMQSGDKLGGFAQMFGSAYQGGLFSGNSKPYQYHSFGETDAGVRRNYL